MQVVGTIVGSCGYGDNTKKHPMSWQTYGPYRLKLAVVIIGIFRARSIFRDTLLAHEF